jgi:hypothetical protein
MQKPANLQQKNKTCQLVKKLAKQVKTCKVDTLFAK